ncbi:MAG TPA: DUF3105 domain-containing protein [Acidimicrobiales bacterium]|nr:DUF3105 domain-containing protein [Acidimicrobiales bacterium]
MPRRRLSLLALLVASVLLAGCAGGDDDADSGAGGSANTTTTTLVRAPATTVSTVPPIEGVQTFGGIDAGHSEAPISYPQMPPVGGIHNPIWQQCGFYPEPVPNEKAVHSLEHGAIWITFRPDLPQAEIDGLATLARSRNLILVSRWDNNLPAPVVVTGWGRQLRLQSTTDPRLLEFVRLYANQGPEINAPC